MKKFSKRRLKPLGMLPIEMFEKGDFLKDSPKSPLEKRPVKNLNLRNI